MRAIVGVVTRSGWSGFVASVHEQSPRYEDEGSVREARGAVTVAAGAWWAAALSVPIGDAPAMVRVQLQRHGAGEFALGTGTELLLAADELSAVVVLLDGLVSQARRDGVLPPAGH